MNEKPPRPAPGVKVWHYQLWCALCLGVVFMAQMNHGIILTNLLTIMLGMLAVLLRLHWGVSFLFIGVGFAQSQHFFMTERYAHGWTGMGRDLNVHDFLLGLGMLGFVIGHCRLQGIWHHLWPPDPRERRGKPSDAFPWIRRLPPIVQHRRKEEDLRPAELVVLAFLVPVIVLAGMGLLVFTRPPRDWLGFPWGSGHLLILFWILVVLGWLTRQILELRRVWTFPPLTARIFLHDQLWTQLRSEQRRLARWRAWRKREDLARQTSSGER